MSCLSLAQTLPPELLSRIFGWLAEDLARQTAFEAGIEGVGWPVTACLSELRAACLVCRRWLIPAQVLHTRSIAIPYANPTLFQRTISSRPDLDDAVRAVMLGLPPSEFNEDYYGRVPADSCGAWLDALATCTKIRHVHLRANPASCSSRILGFLDTLQLETLVCRESVVARIGEIDLVHISPSDLTTLALKPSLRTLTFEFRPLLLDYRAAFAPIPALRSSITTLYLHVWANVGFLRLLAMTASTLQQLDVYAVFP